MKSIRRIKQISYRTRGAKGDAYIAGFCDGRRVTNLAWNVRTLRIKRGLTLEQLAQKADIPNWVIERIENCSNYQVTSDHLVHIASALSAEVDIVFTKHPTFIKEETNESV